MLISYNLIMSLFVGNISSSTTKKALVSHFEQFGKCEVEYYRRFAYINYTKESDGKNALNACNNQELDGNKLKVEFSQRKLINQSSPSDKEQTTGKIKLKSESENEKNCMELEEPGKIPAIFINSSQSQIENPPKVLTRIGNAEKNEDIKVESFEKVQGKVYLMREVMSEGKGKSGDFDGECKVGIDEVESDKEQVEGGEVDEVFDSGEIILTVSIDEPSKFEESKMELVIEDDGKKSEPVQNLKVLGGEIQEKAEIVQDKKGIVDERIHLGEKEGGGNVGKNISEDGNQGEKKNTDSQQSSKNSSPMSKLSQIKPIVPFNDPLTVQEPVAEKAKPSFLLSMGRKKIEPKEEPVEKESLVKSLPETSRTEKQPRKIQKIEENKAKVVKNEEIVQKSSNDPGLEEKKTRKSGEKKTNNSKKEPEKIPDSDKVPQVNEVKANDSSKVRKSTRGKPEVQEKVTVLPKLEEIKNLPSQSNSITPPRDADNALPRPILPPASKETKKPLAKSAQKTQIPSTKQPSPTKLNPASSIPLNSLKFDYEPLDDKTILVHKCAFEVKKQFKDFSNSLLKCKTCNKEIKAKSAESHLNSKFHKDSS